VSVEGLQSAGALVLTAHSLQDGLRLAAQSELSAAILDFALADGEGTSLCQCLKQRGIPFVFHTGYTPLPQVCGSEIVITKPASREELVAAIQGLLRPTVRALQESA
jgi:DNA-binding response OmpR family regulator